MRGNKKSVASNCQIWGVRKLRFSAVQAKRAGKGRFRSHLLFFIFYPYKGTIFSYIWQGFHTRGIKSLENFHILITVPYTKIYWGQQSRCGLAVDNKLYPPSTVSTTCRCRLFPDFHCLDNLQKSTFPANTLLYKVG